MFPATTPHPRSPSDTIIYLSGCVHSTWNAQETLSTLRFGDRTKRITNKPVQNEVMGNEELEGVLADAHRRITVNAGSVAPLTVCQHCVLSASATCLCRATHRPPATIAQLEAQRAQFRDLFQALGMTATDIALMEQQVSTWLCPMQCRGGQQSH